MKSGPHYINDLSASTAVGADRIVWKWTGKGGYVCRVTNAFTVLGVRLFGGLDFYGDGDAADKALHPSLSHEYGWPMPAANVFGGLSGGGPAGGDGHGDGLR